MAMRPRPPTSRPRKAAEPPVLTDAVEDELRREEEQASFDREPAAEITEATLERHEIPSFSDSREMRIAEAAYWRAERRGFTPGHELDDWLDAEKEIDADAKSAPRTG